MHQKTLLALSSIALALAPFQICAQERQPNNIQKQPQQTNHIQPETNQPEQSANDLAALIPQQDLEAMQKAYDEGAYSRAIALAQEALKKAPNAHKLYALIGNAYLLNGAPNDAIAYIQKAQQLGAPLAASTGALCLAYSSVDAKSLPPNAAIDTCIDAANQNPDNDADSTKPRLSTDAHSNATPKTFHTSPHSRRTWQTQATTNKPTASPIKPP